MCTLAQGLLFWLVYFRYRPEVSEDNRARSNRQGTTGDGSGIGRIGTCSRCTGYICRCTGAPQLSSIAMHFSIPPKNKKIPISFGNQDFTAFCFSSKWCHQESNRGHKDFQSFALPTELWHLVAYCLFLR